MAVTEPRFTNREVATLMASRRAEHAPRGSHGLLLSDATNKENRGKFQVEPVTDFALEALHREQKAWEKERDVVDIDAFLWKVTVQD